MKAIIKIIKIQLLIVVLSIGLGSLIHSCSPREQVDELSEVLSGQHKLRKLNIRNNQQSSMSGSFFLGIGDLSGSSSTIEQVKFSWELPNGQFAISTFNTSRIRIEFDSTATQPFIRFEFTNNDNIRRHFTLDDVNDSYRFHYQIKYVVIVCREEDYFFDINLNEL